MNGNTPYAGLPGETQAGRRAAADVPTLTSTQKRLLHRDVSRIAARTREFLPDEYIVDADVSSGVGAPGQGRGQATGRPRRQCRLHPDLENATEEIITSDERSEVARGLAASAALQVKQAVSDNVTPTGK